MSKTSLFPGSMKAAILLLPARCPFFSWGHAGVKGDQRGNSCETAKARQKIVMSSWKWTGCTCVPTWDGFEQPSCRVHQFLSGPLAFFPLYEFSLTTRMASGLVANYGNQGFGECFWVCFLAESAGIQTLRVFSRFITSSLCGVDGSSCCILLLLVLRNI